MLTDPIHKTKTLQARIVSASVILLSGYGFATALNFIYNLAVAQFLGPKGFGDATAVFTLLILLSAVTLSFQIVSAKIVAQQKSPEGKYGGYRSFHRAAWACGMVAGLALLIFRGVVADYLNLSNALPVALISVGVAFYIPLGSRRGYLQGAYGFRRLAASLVLEGAVRLCGSVLMMLLGLGVAGVIAANSVAVAVAYFAIVPQRAAWVAFTLGRGRALREMAQAGVYFAGQVLINSCDIVLVKHFFIAEQAGLYAAVAMVGRVVFAFSQAIVNSVFPLVAGTHEEERKDLKVIGTALLMVLAIGCSIALVLRFAPARIWMALFGAKFHIAGPHGLPYLLALYAITTVIYSLSAVVITYEMSYKIANTSYVQLAFSGLVIAGICLFHSSLREVILVQLVLMVILLFAVTVPFLVNALIDRGKAQPSGPFRTVKILGRVPEEEVTAEFLSTEPGTALRDYRKHVALWNEVPAETEWFELEVGEADLAQIRVFPRGQWRDLGRGHFSIAEIVEDIRSGRNAADSRFLTKMTEIGDRLGQEDHGIGPVLLIGVDNSGPLTILDGNHRLVAAMMSSPSRVDRLRFLCGLSPRMTECCWYKTSFGTLFHYGANVLRDSARRPKPRPSSGQAEPTVLSNDRAQQGRKAARTQGEDDMQFEERAAVVTRLPATLNAKQGRLFLRQIQDSMDTHRPRVVLDCSSLRQLDRPVLHLLLCCLDEAMKRSGDVKLSALPVGAAEVLDAAGAVHLFEIYGTVADAVESFDRLPAAGVRQSVTAAHSQPASESAV